MVNGWNGEMEMDDRELHAALHALAHNMRGMSDGRAGQGRLLSILLENDGITQRELQDMVFVRSGSLSEVLGKLEGAGLIERRPSMEDRRMMRVFLTERGALEARNCANRRTQTMDGVFDCLTEAEKEQLYALVTRVNEHMEKTAHPGGEPFGGGPFHRGGGPFNRGDGRHGRGGRGPHD